MNSAAYDECPPASHSSSTTLSSPAHEIANSRLKVTPSVERASQRTIASAAIAQTPSTTQPAPPIISVGGDIGP